MEDAQQTPKPQKQEEPVDSIPKTSKSSDKPSKKMSKRTKFLLFGGILVAMAILCIGIIIGIILFNRDSGEDSDGSESDTVEEVVEDDADGVDGDEIGADEGADEADLGPRKIAYMKNNNIWVMETDGSNKTQITMDGDGDATRYTAMAWQERGILGYAKCTGSCNVYTYNLASSVETLAHTPPPFTQTIADITWSHDTDTLGVLYTKADYSYAAYVTDGVTNTTVATFGIPPARGGGYFDGLEILFSPDDSKVVVLNTIVDFGDDTIVAAQIDGTPITTIADATHPSFDGNTGFYFLADGRIKKYTFATSTVSNVLLLGANGGYNLKTSPDRNFIAFWNADGSDNTYLYFHDVAGSPALIANGFANADWLDNSELVALKTTPGMGMGYLSDGLSKVQRVGGAETVLENADVYNFEIEPL